MVFFLFV